MVALESWLRARLLPGRHTTYFEVLDALALEGCPICRLSLRAVDRYLDLLSYEAVNDAGVRVRLRAGRGFCNYHSWQFTGEVRNAAGRAMIYRDILGALERPLTHPGLRLAAGDEGAQTLAERLLPAGSCPACQSQERSRQRYLETLVLHLGTPEMREAYRASAGLCLPHLVQALRSAVGAADVELLLAVAARQVGRWRVADRYGVRRFNTAIVAGIVGKPGISAGGNVAGPLAMHEMARAGDGGATCEPAAPARGCPVCAAARAAVDEHLARLPLMVQARGPDEGPAAALALCNAHAWQGLALVSPGMAARLWQPAARAIRRALGEVQGMPAAGTGPRGLLAWGERPGLGAAAALSLAQPCTACRTQAAMEQRAAQSLLERAARGVETLQALCVPHFALALRLGADAQQRSALLGQQAATVADLRQDLAEYIRKQNFRVREAPGKEADSPWRAVAQVAGARGLAAGPLGWGQRGGSD